ncbi:MAG: single-stranded DNA-binding protein [Planctomycetes bacterium]|nr:single-stranded DNA-binding protein [Planctomycetota bacterium]
MNRALVNEILKASQLLARELDQLRFEAPVHTTYNVFRHAWLGHRAYVERFGGQKKKVLFLGMNPGPWGMTQTGVPFGEVAAVRDWMGIEADICRPKNEHPKRIVDGFSCERSEVSGRRLWGLFAQRFGTGENFFSEHFVCNYCPLVFMEESGKNLTPDKLRVEEAKPLEMACDSFLRQLVGLLEPDWVVGIGKYALMQAKGALVNNDLRFSSVLHPSPANPAANRGWGEAVTKTLTEAGIW